MIVDDYENLASDHDRLFGPAKPDVVDDLSLADFEAQLELCLNTNYEFTEDDIRDLLAAIQLDASDFDH